jgi:hypothetical protein
MDGDTVHPREAFTQFADALCYEINMLGGTFDLLSKRHESGASLDTAEDRTIHNSLYHSFLLAARSLDAFLYESSKTNSSAPMLKPSPTKKGRVYWADVHAGDLLKDNEWRIGLPERQAELGGRISRRLLHLTWEDATKPDLIWDIANIARYLTDGLGSFLRGAFRPDASDAANKIRQSVSALSKNVRNHNA